MPSRLCTSWPVSWSKHQVQKPCSLARTLVGNHSSFQMYTRPVRNLVSDLQSTVRIGVPATALCNLVMAATAQVWWSPMTHPAGHASANVPVWRETSLRAYDTSKFLRIGGGPRCRSMQFPRSSCQHGVLISEGRLLQCRQCNLRRTHALA
jgi:hypothetical protein